MVNKVNQTKLIRRSEKRQKVQTIREAPELSSCNSTRSRVIHKLSSIFCNQTTVSTTLFI